MRVQKKPTIRDIARRANVSKSTVARVVNGEGGVKEEKLKAVLAVIEELNYQPNILAQALAGGRSLTIGVLTQDIASPYFGSISRGIHQGLAGSDYSVLFAESNWGQAIEYRIIDQMLRRVDGLIVLEGHLPAQKLLEISHQIPLIVVGRKLPDMLDQCIWIDQFQAAYQAVRYLIELGHCRIAHIVGLLEQHDALERRDGYLQALADAGIEPDPNLLVPGDFLEPSGIAAVEMLLARGCKFSAIFAANDQMAYGARLALYHHGLRVPQDVSLIGFDDQMVSAYMIPPLTTVRQSSVEAGVAAARSILNLINGRPPDVPLLNRELVIRESVAPPIERI